MKRMPQDAEPPTTVLVEEIGILRDGMRRWADQDAGLKVVGEAANQTEALVRVRDLRPTLVLVEPLVCHRDPRGFIAELCRHADIVVAYTSAQDARLTRMFVSSGAAGVIDKRSRSSEMTAEVWRLIGSD